MAFGMGFATNSMNIPALTGKVTAFFFFTSFCSRLLCFCLYFYSYITLIVGGFWTVLWKNISCVKRLMWVQPVPKDADFRSELSWRECSAWSHMHTGSAPAREQTSELACGPCDRRFPDNTGVETDPDNNTNTPQHFFHRFKPLSQWSVVSYLCLFFLYLCVTSMNVLNFDSKWKLGADNISDQQISNWLNSYIKRHPLLFRMFIKVILLEKEYCIIPLVWHEKQVFIAQIKVASS